MNFKQKIGSAVAWGKRNKLIVLILFIAIVWTLMRRPTAQLTETEGGLGAGAMPTLAPLQRMAGQTFPQAVELPELPGITPAPAPAPAQQVFTPAPAPAPAQQVFTPAPAPIGATEQFFAAAPVFTPAPAVDTYAAGLQREIDRLTAALREPFGVRTAPVYLPHPGRAFTPAEINLKYQIARLAEAGAVARGELPAVEVRQFDPATEAAAMMVHWEGLYDWAQEHMAVGGIGSE